MNALFLNLLFIISVSFLNIFSSNVKRINIEQMNKILNNAFSVEKTDYVSSKNNILKIFNRSKRIFEIVSEGINIENDFAINFNKNVFVKYYDEGDILNETLFLEANQFYYDKKNNMLIFLGNVHAEFTKNNIELNTECIVYDIKSEIFFNTHNCIIKMKNVDIEGDNMYLKRDMSLFLLDNIKMSNFKF